MLVEPSIMSRFKRYYPKVQSAYAALEGEAEFAITLNFDAATESTTVTRSGPGEDKRIRLAVVMARFLDPSDRLFYEHVWRELKAQFPGEIPQAEIEQVEANIAHWRRGRLVWELNGELQTAESLYRTLMAEQNWVGVEERLRERIDSLEDPLSLSIFYSYVEGGAPLAEYLFNVIRRVENTDKFKQLYPEQLPSFNKCIYCLSTSNTFTTEEHPVPEGAGNYDYYLPRGYVCDPCQSGPLNALDKKLLESEALAYARVHSVPYTKQGKLPQVDTRDMLFKKTAPGRLSITSKREPTRVHFKDEDNGQISWSITVPGLNIRLLARCVYKMTLGVLAMTFGHEFALDPKFDAARQFILSDQDFPNFMVTQRVVKMPDIRGVFVAQADHPGTVCAVNVFGVILFVNLEETPLMEVPIEEADSYMVVPLFREKKRRRKGSS